MTRRRMETLKIYAMSKTNKSEEKFFDVHGKRPSMLMLMIIEMVDLKTLSLYFARQFYCNFIVIYDKLELPKNDS